MNKKNNKIKKIAEVKTKDVEKENVKKIEEEGDDAEKKSGPLSDGVLDAFEEVAPIDPLLEAEDETLATEEDDEDEIDSGDYRPLDDW